MRTITLLLSLALVSLAACGDGDVGEGGTSLDGAWQLTSGTVDGTEIPLVEGHRITLVVEGTEIGGTAACNSYFGTLEVGEGVSFTGIGATEMYCMPDEVMDSEAAYLEALMRVDTAARQGDDLRLSGPGTELAFSDLPPVPTSDLTGTVWELDTLIEGDAASSVSGGPATLELGEDGTVAGSTGCRSFEGRYVIQGDEVRITELAMEGDCPADLASQDDHVIEVLGDGFTVDIDGDRLTVSSAGGLGLGYRAR